MNRHEAVTKSLILLLDDYKNRISDSETHDLKNVLERESPHEVICDEDGEMEFSFDIYERYNADGHCGTMVMCGPTGQEAIEKLPDLLAVVKNAIQWIDFYWEDIPFSKAELGTIRDEMCSIMCWLGSTDQRYLPLKEGNEECKSP